MKRIMKVLIIFIFLLSFTGILKAQLDVDVKTNIDLEKRKKIGTVDVNVFKGVPGYSFYLYNDYPFNGGELIKKFGPTTETICSFKKLKEGKYVLIVVDKNGTTSEFKEVLIKKF